jgi:hypothetical protein
MKQKLTKVDYSIVNGKTHFGLWFGKYLPVDKEAFVGDLEKNLILQNRIYLLEDIYIKYVQKGFEIRHDSFISKPPLASGPLSYHGTLGVKFVVWGRAFKVMKLLKKGIGQYKKKLVNGRRKYVRIHR